MTKGIVYIVWGNYNKSILNRSINSIQKFGYEHKVINSKVKLNGFRKRIVLYDKAPFDINLYLDSDTIVKDNLDFGFQMAKKYGIACCIAPSSSAYFAHDNNGIKKLIPKDLPQYNCGVIFFNKLLTKKTFQIYSDLLKTCPRSAKNDQPYFSYAVYKTLNPYILPKTWNYRHHLKFVSNVWHGKLKIIHSKVDLK